MLRGEWPTGVRRLAQPAWLALLSLLAPPVMGNGRSVSLFPLIHARAFMTCCLELITAAGAGEGTV